MEPARAAIQRVRCVLAERILFLLRMADLFCLRTSLLPITRVRIESINNGAGYYYVPACTCQLTEMAGA